MESVEKPFLRRIDSNGTEVDEELHNSNFYHQIAIYTITRVQSFYNVDAICLNLYLLIPSHFK